MAELYGQLPSRRLFFRGAKGSPPVRVLSAEKRDQPDGEEDRFSRSEERSVADTVDFDKGEELENIVSEDLLSRLFASRAFRWTILCAVIVNCVVIGAQADPENDRRYGVLLSSLDGIILALFVVEMGLKWYHGFVSFWKDGWNVLDFVVIAASMISPSIAVPWSIRTMTTFRVISAFRMLRLMSSVRVLQDIVSSILNSSIDLLNCLVILFFFLTVFATAGVALFGTNSYFDTFGQSLFSLFIAITQDGWMAIWQSLIDGGFGKALPSIYFVVVIVVGSLVFANIVVGLTITGLQATYEAQRMKEKLQHRSLKQKNAGESAKLPGQELHPIARMDAVDPASWGRQKPFEAPPLDSLAPSTLRHTALVVMALEENALEFESLYRRLSAIVDEVELINDAAAVAAAVAAPSGAAAPAAKGGSALKQTDSAASLQQKHKKKRTLSDAAARLISQSLSRARGKQAARELEVDDRPR